MTFFLTSAALLACAGAYALVAQLLVRRYRLPESRAEHVRVALPADDTAISLYRHRPAERKFVEPVILCHGLGANRFDVDLTDDGTGSDRSSLARCLCGAGFDVWVLELRGRGRASAPRRARWTIADEVREDLPAAIETALRESGAERCFWIGHSWGGIVQYVLHDGEAPAAARVAGLVLVSSPVALQLGRVARAVLHPLGWLLVRLRLGLAVGLLGRLALPVAGPLRWLGKRAIPDLGDLEPAVVRRVFASMLEGVNAGVVRELYEWLARDRYPGTTEPGVGPAFEKIAKPALLLVGSRDVLCRPAATERAARRIAHDDVTVRVMGTATGCRADYAHASILLGPNAPDEVFPVIRDWLEARSCRNR